ncbi:peptidyl-tRNA hydrolase [Corynebacterium ulceribovis]|uniref:peptidyl-tRNA hydrolase n=1 Tax=Corynebacterium ulceribovis TaxID=487732 RepID=UPI00036D586A|nr:peptidyl-tRNA hydrolase [Corynebacterium ulceribovis]
MSDSFAIAYARLAELNSRPDPGHEEEGTARAMNIVLEVPKSPRPPRTPLLEAAAIAVVGLCLSDEAGEDSPLAAGLAAWYGLRIRKIARRARNKAWEDVQKRPGFTANVAGAQARAFKPTLISETPAPLAKLQIGGTDLEPDSPGEPDPQLPLILVDADLGMTVGKAAAQVGHASMLLAAALPEADARAWAEHGFALQVREVPRTDFDTKVANAQRAGDVVVTVQDAGYTEVAPGSQTVAAIWPR